jgi:hypothetical protein
LCENGFGIVWMYQKVGSEIGFIAEFKDRLISCYKQNWHAQVETADKYSWYYSFKCMHEPERYLSFLPSKWCRTALLRFRLRTWGLMSCKRWFFTGQEPVNAACPMCDCLFEDEVHFLFHCPAYETKRRNTHCLQAIIATNNYVNQFCVARLLAATSEEAVIELANFIAEAMTLRRKK